VNATSRPDRGYCVVNERPQRSDHRVERHDAALEALRRADAEERPHPETEIERAGMNKQSFKHVLVPARVRAREPTGLVQLRHTVARVVRRVCGGVAFRGRRGCAVDSLDRVPFRFLVRPRLGAAIRFTDVGANVQRLEIVYRGEAVIALVGDDFLDPPDRIVRDDDDGRNA
jgi:hypothetical protein